MATLEAIREVSARNARFTAIHNVYVVESQTLWGQRLSGKGSLLVEPSAGRKYDTWSEEKKDWIEAYCALAESLYSAFPILCFAFDNLKSGGLRSSDIEVKFDGLTPKQQQQWCDEIIEAVTKLKQELNARPIPQAKKQEPELANVLPFNV